MFLIKHLIQCLQSEGTSLSVKAEIFQVLAVMLPNLQEIYGSHWEECMDILITTWQETGGSDEAIPTLLSSFRLFSRLQSIAGDEESNDDVKDAWSDRKNALFNSLASTLQKFGKCWIHGYQVYADWADSSTTFHQPRDVAVDLLCRFLNVIPIDHLEDASKFFPLITSQSPAVQRAAYTVLHRYIPSVQEQVSFDVALSKTTVGLPDELMSLLLEAPTMEGVNAAYGDDRMWAELRSYLLSWKVVFDHFVNAVCIDALL